MYFLHEWLGIHCMHPDFFFSAFILRHCGGGGQAPKSHTQAVFYKGEKVAAGPTFSGGESNRWDFHRRAGAAGGRGQKN